MSRFCLDSSLQLDVCSGSDFNVTFFSIMGTRHFEMGHSASSRIDYSDISGSVVA